MSKKRIILTGARDESQTLAQRIRARDCVVEIIPTIKIRKRPLNDVSKKMIENADSYDYLIFTSAHAVRFFVEALRARRIKLPKHPRILVVGPTTARAASDAGFNPRIVSKKPGAQALADEIKNIRGKRILFPRSAIAAPESIKTLQRKGAIVDALHLYSTTAVVISKPILAKLFGNKADALVFLSPSSVESFSKNLDGAILRKRAFATRVVAIGPTTAHAARSAGFKDIITAKPSTADGVIETIAQL